MPFKSAKQRRYLYSQKPEVAKKFAMDSAKKGKMVKLKRGGPQDWGQEAAAKSQGSANVPDSNPYSDVAKAKNEALNKSVSKRHSSKSNGPTTITRGTTTGGTTENNKEPKKNFIQNIGYNVKEKTKSILGIGKDKTKNLNDLSITSREIGIKNRNTKDAKTRDLETAKDSKEAFYTNATYKSNRRIDKMLPTATGLFAKAFKKPLGKNAARNAKFFDDFVLGGKNKGQMTGTKKNSIYSKSGMTQEKFSKLSQSKKAEMMADYSKKRQSGEIDAYGRPKIGGEGEGANLELSKRKVTNTATPIVKKIVKPEDKSKTFFGGFKAYKKGKMINTQSKVNGVITGLKKASKLHAGQAKTLSKLKLNKGGGVRYGPPPLRGPNPQVPPVKFSRGGGSALRGTKFKGIF